MSSKKLDHPALEHLAAAPDIVRLLLTGVDERQVYARPAAGGFSIAELLELMSHAEAHCFRAWFDEILVSANPDIEPYDRDAFHAAGAYSNRDAEESLAHWEERRENNLELLRGLEPGILSRTGRHTVLGPFTLENLLNYWASSDLNRIRQLAEMARSRIYAPALGPFQ